MKLSNFISGVINGITATALIAVVGTQLYASDHSWSRKEIVRITHNDVYCLRQNIFFEARNQTVEGQVAVAWVTLNRLDNSIYPDTICGVVKQAKRDSSGKVIRNMCHFSWYCDGKSDKPKNTKAYAKALMIAHGVYHGNLDDFVEGATHYHAHYVTPEWAKTKTMTVRINDHIFYRWE